MASSNSRFKIDVQNYLGISQSAYLETMRALAIAQPSKYFRIRREIQDYVKRNLLTQCYQTYYDLLTGDAPISSFTETWEGQSLKPQVPYQEASDFALSATKNLSSILDQALDMIMPNGTEEFAKLQAILKEAGRGIDTR